MFYHNGKKNFFKDSVLGIPSEIQLLAHSPFPHQQLAGSASWVTCIFMEPQELGVPFIHLDRFKEWGG